MVCSAAEANNTQPRNFTVYYQSWNLALLPDAVSHIQSRRTKEVMATTNKQTTHYGFLKPCCVVIPQQC